MGMKRYICKYCGAVRLVPATQIPLKTKCYKAPSGLHVWARVAFM